MTTDTSEKGLERRICMVLTGAPCDVASGEGVGERPASYGVGWIGGDPQDYDRGYCVDLVQLSAFLRATQLEVAEALDLGNDSPTRRQFLARLQGQISKRGTIDVIRRGVKHGPHDIDVFYGTPSAENLKAQELYRLNRFSVTRQLRYSQDQTALSLDLVPVHQRPADRDLRTEEQPDEADGGRRGGAVQAGPQPAGTAVRAGALPGALSRWTSTR